MAGTLFEARYEDECDECFRGIEPGDMVAYSDWGSGLLCEECAEEEGHDV